MPARMRFAHLPTPLWRSAALDALIGAEVWVKRDDMTGGAEAGNKIRKLEYLFARARAEQCDVVVTCGGLQSNHARATALLGRQLDFHPILLLRTADVEAPLPHTGNVLLNRLAGAEIRLITPEQYKDRQKLFEAVTRELSAQGRRPFVIPEGGSNGLGALGYVEAMREVREQLELGLGGGPKPFDVIVHACGSGGTAAGVALGARRYEVAAECRFVAVCDDRVYFQKVIEGIIDEARACERRLDEVAPYSISDEFKGPAYGIASAEQKAFMVEVTRRTGLVLDPVYTGKALFALAQMPDKPRRVLFIHTGGLPGLLAEGESFAFLD
jgi:D-cysteine desulfhydrase